MKAIRIFLLVLIIIGLIALATQKTWVPKLVDKIISYDPKSTNITPTPTQANITLADGEQCYVFSHNATKEEPYTVTEFINITIKGKTITGAKSGTQNGPDMTNGYTGTLLGTLDKDTINTVFSYTIEGSKNKEKEIYKASLMGIDKLRYPLTEGKGILLPDTTKEYKLLHYARVGCSASN